MDDDDSIAIVGIGCRFPGADNIDEFWKILVNEENHVKDIPKERWNNDAFYDSDPDAPGKSYVRKAGLISNHDAWDNRFFGISDTEASQVDPQQRLVLECTHMALEDGGITRNDVNGTVTGVYIGSMNDDYRAGSSTGDNSNLNNYTLTGNSPSIISARVSYFYNLLGPAVTIDTACSSALVAIHTAALSIKAGDCTMAICGGVNSILYPEMFIPLSKARMVSPSGQCQAFSSKADGYARGEGCGVVILKKLKQAIEDGNRIWATIVTGCNQDGHTATPITAPSSQQQINLLHKVYKENNVDPSLIQYIEAHGTGTPLGDPTEVNSLGTFFNDYKKHKEDDTSSCIYIGSVKTNIGHTESAAGVAGLIKTLLMMDNESFVTSLHADKLNPKIDFKSFKFVVAKSARDWPKQENGSRLACVNCFGFGGTNSHAIVKQFRKEKLQPAPKEIEKEMSIVALSAKDDLALDNSIVNLNKSMKNNPYNIRNLSFTLLCKRDHYSHRIAFVVDSVEELQVQCHDKMRNVGSTKPREKSSFRKIFVFCGVGTTWMGMCKELLLKFTQFRKSVDEIDALLIKRTGWSISSKLEEFTDISDPFINHIAIFTCQVGLAKLWKHWGIEPDAIVGQSVGEIAAAYISGILSLKDAVTVIYERSRLLSDVTGGEMAVVTNSDISLIENIIKDKCNVNIAVYNSLRSCTLSGDPTQLTEVCNSIQQSPPTGKIHKLGVQCAYHSHFVQQCSEHLPSLLCKISQQKPSIPIYSTVTGDEADSFFATANYWKDNIRKPVLFSKAIEHAAKEDTLNIYLEIGPKPVLIAHSHEILSNYEVLVLPSLKPNNEIKTLFQSLASLYQHELNPVWKNIYEENVKPSTVHLPPYPYTRKPNLYESNVRARMSQGIDGEKCTHLFLESLSSNGDKYKATFRPSTCRFIYDHQVQNRITIPGAVYCEIALEVGKNVLTCSLRYTKAKIQILKPVSINDNQTCQLFVNVNINSNNQVKFSVSKEEKDGTVVAEGSISKMDPERLPPLFDVNRMQHFVNEVPISEFYNQLQKHGLTYGDTLRHFHSIKICGKEILAEIRASDTLNKEIGRTNIHPAVADMVLQTVSPILLNSFDTQHIIFPVSISDIILHQPLEKEMICYSKVLSFQQDQIIMNSLISRNDGIIIAEFKGIEYKVIGDAPGISNLRYEVVWKEKLAPYIEESSLTAGLLVISCKKDVLEKLQGTLHEYVGQSLVLHGEEETSKSIDHKLTQRIESTNVITGIVFAPGYRILDNEPLSDELYNTMRFTCHICLRIVQAIDSRQIPLVVVTENTQNYPLSDSSDSAATVNVFGSELWGMVRSIVDEPKKTNSVLIDVCPKLGATNNMLRKMVTGIIKGEVSNVPEMLIYEEKLFVNTLQRSKKDSKTFRQNLYDTKCSISVKSMKYASISKPYFTMQNLDDFEFKFGMSNKKIVRVECAYLHPSFIYPVTETEKRCKNTVWYDGNDDSHQLLAIECTGVSAEGVSSSYSFPLPSGVSEIETRNNPNVAFCYPVQLVSEVLVPNNCIIKLKKIPGYIPGILHSAFISWHFIPHVPRNVSVCIIFDNESQSIIVNVLQKILQIRRQCAVRTIALYHNNFLKEFEENTLIILGHFYPATIASKIQKVKTLISLRHYLPFQHVTDLRKFQIQAEIYSLETEQMFDVVHLAQTFPKVKKWLLQNWQKTNLGETKKQISSSTKHTLYISSTGENEWIDSPKAVFVQREKLFRKRGCYVVIGGLTGLGWEILKLLSRKGAGNIVSISRRPPSSSIKQQIENLMSLFHVTIHILKADVSEFKQLEAVFKEIDSLLPTIPVKGIFQGAGVLEDALYMEMTPEKFDVALRPKVLGTWNLHLLSEKYPLDYFVMQSSIASILGNIGQSNYAAGNSFLDALAHYRRSKGLPGQSINWGALDLGMVNELLVKTYLEDMGFLVLDVQRITACFLEALFSNAVQMTYSLFDWKRISETLSYGNMAPLRYRVLNFIKEESQNYSNISLHIFEDVKFNKLSEDEKHSKMTSLVCNVTSRVVGMGEGTIKNNSTIRDLGMDSQMMIEFINLLFDMTGCRIPYVFMATDIFSISMAATYLIEHIPNNRGPAVVATSENSRDFLTPMESIFYSKYMKDSKDPSLAMCIEFKISQSLCYPTVWRKVLQWQISVYPELRTLYRKSYAGKRKVAKTVLSPDDAIIDFRNVRGMTVNGTDSSVLDPSKDLPIRVFLQTFEIDGIVKFLLNRMVFDLIGASKLIKEIYFAVTHYLTSNKLPKITSQEPFDMASKVNETLHPQLTVLSEFWKKELALQKEDTTFATKNREKSLSYNEKSVVEYALSNSILDKMEKFLQKRNVNKFTLFTSLYQILLHLRCHVKVVSVWTKTDIRVHVPGLQERICFGSNYIPLSAQMNFPNHTIGDFIERNHRKIGKCLANSLYPYTMIIDDETFDENCIRHEVIEEDVTHFKEISNDRKYWMKTVNVVEGNGDMETSLLLLNNGPECDFKLILRFNLILIDGREAQKLLNDVVRLLKICLESPETKLQELDKQLNNATSPRDVNTIENCYSDGQIFAKVPFQKQTSSGWDHLVYVSVDRRNDRGYCIMWGANENHPTKIIPLTRIQSISGKRMNGLSCVVLMTSERQFIFKSSDSKMVEEWRSKVNKMISDQGIE